MKKIILFIYSTCFARNLNNKKMQVEYIYKNSETELG